MTTTLFLIALLFLFRAYADGVFGGIRRVGALEQFSISTTKEWPIFNASSYIKQHQEPDEELWSMLQQVDPKRIKQIIEKLVSFGTRHSMSSQNDSQRGIGAARDWIASEMKRFVASSNGRMTISLPSYEQTPQGRISKPTRISNVVATLKGSDDPNRIYVISGHYDSMCSNVMDFSCDAPGANDDASGVAVVIELARIMASRKPRATIIFATVAGEEQGLLGSKFMAQTLKFEKANVEAMLNNDIVGSPNGPNGQSSPHIIRLFAQGIPKAVSEVQLQQILKAGGENDSPSRQLGRYIADVATNNATQMSVEIIFRTDRFGRGGDHQSFLDQGYPAIRFTEPHENFAHQHQNVRVENGVRYGDLSQFVDFDYIARVARVNMASLWNLAMSPGRVPSVKLDSGGMTDSSKLSWSKPSDAGNIKHYEIVWRQTTSPAWTNYIVVGNALTATIDVNKDNVIFGVRAVGRNGYTGPVTAVGWDLDT